MGKGGGSEDGMLQEVATYSVLKKNDFDILCDNLYCKIALEKRILVFVVVCGVQRHALFLNQSTSLISKLFSETKANSVSQRRTRYLQLHSMTHLDFEQ